MGFILDPEFTCYNHIEYIVLESRKRLNILKYIAGWDCKDDAATLKATYLVLIRPILEFRFPFYCCASHSKLKKLEKAQLSVSRITTGLRHRSQKEIALLEADLQTLKTKRLKY